jgi:hypothetical protein
LIGTFIWRPASRSEDSRAGRAQSRRNGLPYALGSASHENALAIKFLWKAPEFMSGRHHLVSTDAITCDWFQGLHRSFPGGIFHDEDSPRDPCHGANFQSRA